MFSEVRGRVLWEQMGQTIFIYQFMEHIALFYALPSNTLSTDPAAIFRDSMTTFQNISVQHYKIFKQRTPRS